MLSSYVSTPLQSAQIHENATKISLNLTVSFEPDGRLQRCKVLDRLWIIKVTYQSVETNKLQRVLRRA